MTDLRPGRAKLRPVQKPIYHPFHTGMMTSPLRPGWIRQGQIQTFFHGIASGSVGRTLILSKFHPEFRVGVHIYWNEPGPETPRAFENLSLDISLTDLEAEGLSAADKGRQKQFANWVKTLTHPLLVKRNAQTPNQAFTLQGTQHFPLNIPRDHTKVIGRAHTLVMNLMASLDALVTPIQIDV